MSFLSAGPSVSLSINEPVVYFGKTADSIEMPFGIVGRVGQRSDRLDGVQLLHGKGHFGGGGKWDSAM